MNRTLPTAFATTALLLCGASAQGYSLQFPLPIEGHDWPSGTPWCMDFALGDSFVEIDDVYMDWSGQITAGLYRHFQDPNGTPFPVGGSFKATWFNASDQNMSIWTTVDAGTSTYPAPEPFNCRSVFSNPDDWSDLLLATGTLKIAFGQTLAWSWVCVIEPDEELDHATLTVEGTRVPEPSTILLLLAAAALARRRWT